MFLRRFNGRIARLSCPLACVMLLALAGEPAWAQSQTQQPNPGPPAIPAATPAAATTSTAPNAPAAPEAASAPDAISAPTADATQQASQLTGQQTSQAPGAVPSAVNVSPASRPALPGYAPETEAVHRQALGSTYIPVDSFVYPEALRLYSMGYLDTAFINMRPWTRQSLLHMLQQSEPAIVAGNNEQAMEILAKLEAYIASEGAEDDTSDNFKRGDVYGVQSLYTRVMSIDGQTLRDSFHLGQTISQDYGRPYEPGFNNITGFASVNEYKRFSLYVRGEYQHSPSGYGYSTTYTGNPLAPNGLAETLSDIDEIPYTGYTTQATIPAGAIAAQNPFSLEEAALSFHFLGHEISGGKSDAWEGPGLGSAMNWSNNAEDIYSFRINRVEPLYIPWVSKVLGAMRYDFFVGSLKGHSYPNEPWVHSEMFSFAPTSNFQFSFSRSVVWGGHGHGCLQPNGTVTPCDEPITLHTFFKSFFSFSDTTNAEKYSVDDPGARYSDFSFSWRLPFISHHVTLYTGSSCHDDVSPISAPRRAGYRPGIYLSQVPGLPKIDLRVEGVSTDCSTTVCQHGTANYWEVVQRQGYTNKGFIMGDWIGREAMGGQAWLTYHFSGNEWVQVEYLKKRTPTDFIPGGTSQNQYKVDVLKRLGKNVELDAWLQVERWKAPIYLGYIDHSAILDSAAAFQVTWFPKLHSDANGFGGR